MTPEREPNYQLEGVPVPRSRTLEIEPGPAVVAGIYAAIARGREARDARQAPTD